MSTLATLVVRLVADASNLVQGLGQAEKKSQSFLSGVGQAMQSFGKVAIGGMGMAAGAATGLGVALGKLVADAAPLETVRDSFAGLAEAAGSSQQEMLAALERGSAGMISQRDLMLQFNKAAQLVSTDFAAQLPGAMEYVAKVAASTGQDFGFLMDSLVTGVGRLSPAILDNLSIQASLSEATARAAEMFGVEEDELTKAQTQAGMMAVVMEKLAENTAAMPDVAGTAAAGMAGLQARLQNAKDFIGGAFVPALGALLDAFLPLIDSALPPLASLLETGGEALRVYIETVKAGVDPLDAARLVLEKFLPPELHPTIEQVSAGIQNVITRSQELVTAVSPFIQQASRWIGSNVKLQDVLTALGIAIASVVVPALVSIVTTAAPVIAVGVALIAAVAAVREAWESDFLGIRTFIENVMDKIIAIFDLFVAQWRTIYEAFAAAFQGDWEGFGAKLREYWDRAWAAIAEIGKRAWDDIRSFFTNTDWGAIGKNILRGIADGIRNGVGWLKDAAKAAAQAALDAAKGFLGISSPSRAFARVGQWATLGFARGMQDISPIDRAAAQLGQAALRATERATSTQYVEAPVTVNATMASGLDIEELAWRVSEIIGRRSLEYAV